MTMDSSAALYSLSITLCASGVRDRKATGSRPVSASASLVTR